MKCRECKFVDINNLMDKCPKCGSNDWVKLTNNDLLISKRKLDSIIKNSDGDFDFLLFELRNFWNKEQKRLL